MQLEGFSEFCVEAAIHGYAARLIAGRAYRPALVDLIFALHDFIPGL
jgi:hypothetical protein